MEVNLDGPLVIMTKISKHCLRTCQYCEIDGVNGSQTPKTYSRRQKVVKDQVNTLSDTRTAGPYHYPKTYNRKNGSKAAQKEENSEDSPNGKC